MTVKFSLARALGNIFASAAVITEATEAPEKETEEVVTENVKSWFKINVGRPASAADSDGNPVDPEILVYDEIGGWGVGAADFQRQLKALGDVKKIKMRVNSPGGDSFEGIAIHNVLAAHPAEIECHIDGMAASAASLLCMAADKIVAPENTFMVVHNPYAMTIGPADAHRAMADDLQRVTDAYASTYASRSGQSLDDVKALMAEDRLMGAKEAKEKGYVDEVAPPKLMAATFDLKKLPTKWSSVSAIYQEPEAAAASGTAVVEAAQAAQAEPEKPGAAEVTAAAAVESYGMTDIEQTVELCAIARVPSAVATKFIAAKTPVKDVRAALAKAAAEQADGHSIEIVDVTQDIADGDVPRAKDGTPLAPQDGEIANWDSIKKKVRGEFVKPSRARASR